jgi:hypothetical protein
MVASKGGLRTQIFSTGGTKFALTACLLKPGNTHSIPFPKGANSRANPIHDPHCFMSWNDGTGYGGQFSLYNMKIRPTNPAD